MVNQNVPQNVNINALISFMVLAVAIVIARTTTRWWKTYIFQAEDYFMWFALASFISMCAIYLAAFPTLYRALAVTAGEEPPWATIESDLVAMLHQFFAVQILFWTTLWSVKFSLLWMFRRLTLGLPLYGRIWLAIAIFTFITYLACIVTQFTSCSSLAAWFIPEACQTERDAISKAASLWFSLAVDLLTDMLIMTIPIRLLWNLQISLPEKISVGIVFTVGAITMIFAVIRCVTLDSTAGGGQVSATWLGLWAGIEGFVAVVVGCLPAFAVFVRGCIMASRITYGSSSYSNHAQSSKVKSRIRTESVLLANVDCNGMKSTSTLRDNNWQQERSDEENGHKIGQGL